MSFNLRSPLLRTLCFIAFLFFFSSRRRHTRLQGDWSSDVCSSDLVARADRWRPGCTVRDPRKRPFLLKKTMAAAPASRAGLRSEERRVGKECRYWGWAELEKKKDVKYVMVRYIHSYSVWMTYSAVR